MAKKLLDRREIPIAPGEHTFGLRIFKEEWQDVETGKQKTYWKYDLPNVVQIFALTNDDLVIAIEEFQPSVGSNYLHLIGETLESGESPLEAARRGLLEESGYSADNVVLLSNILENSGRSDRIIHCVLATGCNKIAQGEDDITIKPMPISEFWNSLIHYFTEHPDKSHGGGNSLKCAALALTHLNQSTSISKRIES